MYCNPMLGCSYLTYSTLARNFEGFTETCMGGNENLGCSSPCLDESCLVSGSPQPSALYTSCRVKSLISHCKSHFLWKPNMHRYNIGQRLDLGGRNGVWSTYAINQHPIMIRVIQIIPVGPQRKAEISFLYLGYSTEQGEAF